MPHYIPHLTLPNPEISGSVERDPASIGFFSSRVHLSEDREVGHAPMPLSKHRCLTALTLQFSRAAISLSGPVPSSDSSSGRPVAAAVCTLRIRL